MNSNIDKFLDSYKTLEAVIREKEKIEIREWENKNEGKIESERLKVCRILRNYIIHNDIKGFICKIDNNIIKWIKSFTKIIKNKTNIKKVKNRKK